MQLTRHNGASQSQSREMLEGAQALRPALSVLRCAVTCRSKCSVRGTRSHVSVGTFAKPGPGCKSSAAARPGRHAVAHGPLVQVGQGVTRGLSLSGTNVYE